MKTMSLVTSEGRALARSVRVADTFIARTIGLLLTRELGPDDGVLLIPAASVHTFAMRALIDVVFLDRRMRVLNLSARVPPRRVRIGPTGAARVLALAVGRIEEAALQIGSYVLVADELERRRRPRPALGAACVTRPEIQFSLRLPLRSYVGPTSAETMRETRST